MFWTFALLLTQCISAQELPSPFPKEEVQKLEKKVLKMYKKASQKHTDNVRFFHVFDVGCDDCEIKETYADTSFIKKLHYGYVRVKCKKYLASISIVCDSTNQIVGVWYWDAYSNHAVIFSQAFADTLDARHIVQVYRVLDGVHRVHKSLKTPLLIGVTDDYKTCLIDSERFGYKVYPIAECSDMQWQYLIKEHPKIEVDSSAIPKKKIVVKELK